MDYVVDRTREINDPSAVLDAPSVGADGPSQHDTASAKGADSRYLERGTDVEIAHLIADELRRSHKPGVPFCEGEFWQYTGTHWEPIPASELRCHARIPLMAYGSASSSLARCG